MKKISFAKFEGTGNDFIIIDRPKCNLKRLAVKICHRKKGLGADGLLVCEKSKRADFKMRIINADGSEAEMCGNGIRCFAAYLRLIKKLEKSHYRIETIAGLMETKIKGANICARLTDPKHYQPDIPLKINKRTVCLHYLDTGVPHTVVFVADIDKINVRDTGRLIRRHRFFSPRGTNVNFVEQLDLRTIKVRTYERGVEDETFSCGTGAVASAIISFLKSHLSVFSKKNVAIKVLTSHKEMLNIQFNLKDRRASDVWLKGKVNLIAKGHIHV